MGTVISITAGHNADGHTNGYHNLMQHFKDSASMNEVNLGFGCINAYLRDGIISEEEARLLRDAGYKKEYELTHKVVEFKK